MSYYNSSAARELPVIDTPVVRDLPLQNPTKERLKVVERTKQTESLAFINFRTILMFFAVVGCICMMLHSQAKLNEVNGQIARVEKQITQLQSEYVKMQSNLDSTLSHRNVAKVAEQELGMQRISPTQVVHIHIYEEDSVEVVKDAEPQGISETVESFAARIISNIESFFSAA